MFARIPLVELIDVEYGAALKADQRDSSGPFPVFGSNGEVGRHSSRIVDHPTVIVGRKGSVGEITFAPNGGWPIDTAFFTRVKDPSRLDLRYLYYALKGARLDQHEITTSIPGLSRNNIYRTVISVPPLAEQRRIAALLDVADALVAKRRQALATLDTLLQSLFLDMFGESHVRQGAWQLRKVDDLLASGEGRIRTGPFGSQLRHSEFEADGVPVLGIDNVVTNEFRWTEPRCLPLAKYDRFRRYKVLPGDVLVTIMGTVGRACVAPDDLPECMSTKHLCVLTLNRNEVAPRFLWASFLFDPAVRSQMKAAGKGAIMEGWNSTAIRNLALRVPPLSLQERFARVCELVIREIVTQRRGLLLQDSLFTALQFLAFAGPLRPL